MVKISRPAARYSAATLVRHGLRSRPWPRAWRTPHLRDTYDVVIIGAGVHGLATAYYLATKWGVTNVAVIDKGYIGGGGSGRNTAIVRSNYLTPDGVAFYDRSVKLYEQLAAELNFNVMFSQRGHLTLAHNDSSLRTMRWRAEVNKLQGVDSEVIGPEEIARLVPFMDVSERHALSDPRRALPPTGRHDPPRRRQLGLRPRRRRAWASTSTSRPSSLGIDVVGGRGRRRHDVAWPHRDAARRQLHGRLVVADLGDGRRRRCRSARTRSQAAVTEPVKPFLSTVVVSGHAARVRQPDRPRASSSSAPAPTRSPRTRCVARWRSARSWPATCWS